nr:hypothetical protein GCM10025699_23450 [Microbacterium flavescens]
MVRRSAVLAITALILMGVLGTPPATAAAPLVTVSGTVTGAPGDDDFWLTFHRLGESADVTYRPMVFAGPDFTAEIPPGRYHVFISTEESASSWLGGTRFPTGSEVLVVGDADRTLDITLSAEFGSISGVVGGFPAGLNHLITVEAYAYDAATNQADLSAHKATPIGTGQTGAFTIDGLAPGVYQLRGYTEPDIGPPYRYLPERVVVTVTAGSVVDVGTMTFSQEPVQYQRVAGLDRYRTAAALSAKYFGAARTDTVFIASGTAFPDALSAGAAAAVNGAPVLLVPRTGLPAAVASELRRIEPATIYVIGGAATVSTATQTALRGYAGTVVRISGPDRYATSRAVAAEFFDIPAIAYIATGRDFPDALAASAVAGALGGPLVLVDGQTSTLDATTRDLVGTFDAPLRIVGDTGVVSAGIEADLAAIDPGVTRRGGVDRYETATLLAGDLPVADTWFYATGTGFADATAGGAVAGQLGSPLKLVRPSCDPNWFDLGYMYSQGPRTVVVVGGESAIKSGALGRAC